jgi:hypothetical protein
MATLDKNANETPSSEFPRGTVGPCTPDDRAALTDLYRAVYPDATAYDLANDIKDSESAAWGAYRDSQGEIRVAMFIWTTGVVWILANPEECGSPEVRKGFLMLAKDVRRVLAQSGVTEFAVVHAACLNEFGALLEREGFFSKPISLVRNMHFDDSGEAQRVN